MQISMFLKVEEAPAFNFLLRIISPVVYLFIVSAILYKLNFDAFVNNIYMVSVYYVSFRLLFNLATNRALLMNWLRQFLYWVSIITLSYFSYTEIISTRENILPDFTTIANELWIIILIFLFHTLNRIRVSSDNTIERKQNYLESRYKFLNKKYNIVIDSILENDKLKSIAYAIMIYEDFNRPKIVRLIENLSFFISKKKHSLGLMQVQTDKFINDKESVQLGVEKLNESYRKYIKSNKELENSEIRDYRHREYYDEWSLEGKIISDYNGGDSYTYEVRQLVEKIFELYRPENRTNLLEHFKGDGYNY